MYSPFEATADWQRRRVYDIAFDTTPKNIKGKRTKSPLKTVISNKVVKDDKGNGAHPTTLKIALERRADRYRIQSERRHFLEGLHKAGLLE